MYYKVKKGTETFKRLEKVWSKITDCNKKSLQFVQQLGYEKYGTAHGTAGGGISFIYAETKPEGFKIVGKKYQNLFYPKASNKDLLKQIAALPTVSYDEYNSSIRFEEQFQGTTHYNAFGSRKRKDVYLIEINDECDYTPFEDMIEIVSSEWKALSDGK
ncbi:MAG: hypothetical protein QM503_10640 [Bacteroidota bacterium]